MIRSKLVTIGMHAAVSSIVTRRWMCMRARAGTVSRFVSHAWFTFLCGTRRALLLHLPSCPALPRATNKQTNKLTCTAHNGLRRGGQKAKEKRRRRRAAQRTPGAMATKMIRRWRATTEKTHKKSARQSIKRTLSASGRPTSTRTA